MSELCSNEASFCICKWEHKGYTKSCNTASVTRREVLGKDVQMIKNVWVIAFNKSLLCSLLHIHLGFITSQTSTHQACWLTWVNHLSQGAPSFGRVIKKGGILLTFFLPDFPNTRSLPTSLLQRWFGYVYLVCFLSQAHHLMTFLFVIHWYFWYFCGNLRQVILVLSIFSNF